MAICPRREHAGRCWRRRGQHSTHTPSATSAVASLYEEGWAYMRHRPCPWRSWALQAGAGAPGREESKAGGPGPGETAQTSETRGKAKVGHRGPEPKWLGQVWLVFALRLRSSVCEAVLSLLREFPLFLLKRNKYAKFEASGVFTFFLLRCKCVIIAWSRSRSCNITQNIILIFLQ